MALAAMISAMPGASHADSLRCEVSAPCPTNEACLTEAVSIAFDIDRTQFAPANDPADPPRRKITFVRMGDRQFPAEAILMGGIRGFWAEGLGGGDVLFIVQPDGTANYVEEPSGFQMEGTCEG